MPKSNDRLRKNKSFIYMDYASSALVSSPNSSAIHDLGLKEKKKLEAARKKIADILKTQDSEIIFTSGATESNNLSILGIGKGHIVTTNIEHASVIETAKHRGGVSLVPVEPDGIVDPKKL